MVHRVSHASGHGGIRDRIRNRPLFGVGMWLAGPIVRRDQGAIFAFRRAALALLFAAEGMPSGASA
jgi:hypothetical protein